MKLGTIESIYRYPVKGMRGEEIPHTYTAFTGLMGDRVYGVVAADGSPGHPWHTGRDYEEFILNTPRFVMNDDVLLPPTLDATYGEWPQGIDPIYPDSDEFKVSVETPEGEVFGDIEDPAFIAHLEKLSGRSLRIHHTQRGQFDARPVSLISTSAVAKIGEDMGVPMDKRRFRANFYVEWENQNDPFFELSLVGKTLKIGDNLELKIDLRDPRCKAITLDPDTAETMPKLLRYLARNHDGDAGVFGVVLQRGKVNQGDPVYLA